MNTTNPHPASQQARPEPTLKNLPDGVFMHDERKHLCLEAVYEIDVIARMLPGIVPRTDENGEIGPHHAVRCIAGRMLRLTSLLMSGLDESNLELADLEHFVSFERGQG